ncbi:MAG: hypothetical protein QXE80_03480 [Pyrobaculum sp.]
MENGKLVLDYYRLVVYVGTGLIRTLLDCYYVQEEPVYVNLRGSVCYNARQDEYTTWNFSTRQSDTQSVNKLYKIGMNVVTNLSGEDYLAWFAETFDQNNFVVQYTLTNALGESGAFKTDANNDGLADGWTISSNLGKRIEQSGGVNWQYFWETYTSSSRGLIREFSATTNDIYFVRLRQRVTTTDTDTRFAGTVRIYDYNSGTDSGVVIPKFPYEFVGQELERFGTIRVLSSRPSIIIYTSYAGLSVVGREYHVWVAQVGVYNLSALGRLPKALADYLGVLNWVDLATTAVIRALDGRRKTGHEWLNEIIPYVDSTQTVTLVLNFPFKSKAYYEYKPYVFRYDCDYRAVVDIGQVTKSDSKFVKLSYEFEGRRFETTAELVAGEVMPVELVALLQSRDDAVVFTNVFGGYNTKNNTVVSQYSVYLNAKSTGLWYYDRVQEKTRLYGVNEILLIHKDNFDKLGEPIVIGQVQLQRTYITPLTHSQYAIVLLPSHDARASLRQAGLSETYWQVENGRFVIDSGYWYALYINLLEELSGPDDDKYEVINGAYVSNNETIPTATTAFYTVKQGDDWYLVFDRSKLTEPAEEFYCLVAIRDLFDNFDTAFVYATGYVDFAGKRHKTYASRFVLQKDAFTISDGTTIIPLGKYLKMEDDR